MLDDPDDVVVEDPVNNIISRTVQVLSPSGPAFPPTIESFTINSGVSDSGSLQVFLDVSAIGAANLLYVEYQYIQSRHDWVPLAISPWLPYDAVHDNYPWTLQPGPGVHYLQAWAAGSNGFVSLIPGMTFVNYLPSQAHAAMSQIYVYHYRLVTGENLLARLTSLSGDADLYAWDPNAADIGRSETGDLVEEVEFTTNISGLHQVEVEGYTSADFLLEINPSTMLRTGPSITLRTSPAARVLSPTPRGRGIPLTTTLPDENIGLPEAPLVLTASQIFLPMIVR